MEQVTLPECSDRSEIHKKTVVQASWNSEVEMELRELGWEDHRFANHEDREKLMEKVDRERATTIYAHKHCTELCKKRGLYMTLSSAIGYTLNL